MKLKITALILSGILILSFCMGCKPNTEGNTSDISSIASQTDETESGNAQNQDTSSKNDKDKGSSTVTTSSPNSTVPSDTKVDRNSSSYKENSSGKDIYSSDNDNDNNTSTKDDDYSSDSDSTSSFTYSSSIKYYDQNVQIGTYHLAMRWCDYYGTDFASREKQFREVVEEGYFNTYFLHAQDTEYLLKEIEIIVENGGTFWLTLWNFHSHKESIQNHERELRKVIDSITKAGYREYLNGMFMDEPIWNGQANRDFLLQTQLYYNTFGLRTFPVFATGEFSGSEGNLNTPAASMGKIATEAMKYVTDVGFDSYGVDVRDKAAHGYQAAQYEAWSKTLDTPVTNGKDYYIGYKRLLQSRIGHAVNYWYFPTAFEWNIYNGGKANEAFCMAHLEFMAEDMLNEDFNGGIALYTYYRHSSHRTVALAQHLDVTDKNGNYIHYTDFEKWTEYSKLLRKTREKFDSIKASHVDLTVYS